MRLFLACIFLISFVSIAQKKPNVVFILADDLGIGDVSCMNPKSKINTPNIDLMAKKGIKFSDAHSNSAVCTPSRYGILTGRYAWRSEIKSGVLWSYDSLLIKTQRMTLASILKTKGYETACIGKWHLGLGWQKNGNGEISFEKPLRNGPNDIGFDYFYGITASLDIPPYFYIENNKITATKIDTIAGTKGKGFWREGPIGDDFKHKEVLDVFTQKAIDFIGKKRKEPYFLYLPLAAPHTPILPSKEYLGKSKTNEYGDFVLMVDDMIGKIIQAIEKTGEIENTIIVFTSDNGCSTAADIPELQALGHEPSYIYRGQKADIYEGGHRIPLIVRWDSKIPNSKVSNQTVCLTDFFATMAEITQTKLEDNAGEDSFSLLPIFESKPKKYERTSTVVHSIDGNFGIMEGDWKLNFTAGSGGWSFPRAGKEELGLPKIQLYNLKDDPSEKVNLQDKYPEKVNEMRLLMQKTIENGRSTKGQKQANDGEFLKDKMIGIWE
ncbi:arylsulfatase [Lacihabitans sp. LS3-19]|uniref:sulfatase family protein n=1 Tax=Lacihabitans sp. LS3-19 TaxID=2487335 RepID=UPI0020CD2B6C|nr:arylsulfatase [Lacihabitans sp. LS3-19]MCP9767934.1 arylsulfatase [Lacihabitans sp. LS3-19]